jgi:AraC-like DNA-binding protein
MATVVNPLYTLDPAVAVRPMPHFGVSLRTLIGLLGSTFQHAGPPDLVYAGRDDGFEPPPKLARDWSYTRPRYHDLVEVVLPLHGRARLLLQDRAYPVTAGQIVFIGAGVLHNELPYAPEEPYTLCWLRIKPGAAFLWLSEYNPALMKDSRFQVSDLRRIMGVDDQLLTRTELEITERRPLFEPAALAFLRAFYYTLLRAAEQRETGTAGRLAHVVSQYIEEHYAEPFSVQTLADALTLNPSYLCTAFKRHTGVTIGAYLTAVRLRHAMRLLRTTAEPVGVVAEQCGFKDIYRFSKVFRQHTGDTPTHFRKAYRDPGLSGR